MICAEDLLRRCSVSQVQTSMGCLKHEMWLPDAYIKKIEKIWFGVTHRTWIPNIYSMSGVWIPYMLPLNFIYVFIWPNSRYSFSPAVIVMDVAVIVMDVAGPSRQQYS